MQCIVVISLMLQPEVCTAACRSLLSWEMQQEVGILAPDTWQVSGCGSSLWHNVALALRCASFVFLSGAATATPTVPACHADPWRLQSVQ